MKALKIIGIVLAILVVIAIGIGFMMKPHLEKFQSKAKQQAGKLTLGSAYVALQAHRAEYGAFTTDLRVMGFGGGMIIQNSTYKFGFTRPLSLEGSMYKPEGEQIINSDGLLQAGQISYDPTAKLETVNFEALAQQYCPDCTATAEGFKLIAIGNIDNDSTLDIWTVDQDKNFVKVVDDVEN